MTMSAQPEPPHRSGFLDPNNPEWLKDRIETIASDPVLQERKNRILDAVRAGEYHGERMTVEQWEWLDSESGRQ